MPLALPFLLAAAYATPTQQVSPETTFAGQEVVPAVIESTERYIPQISHRYTYLPGKPENPIRQMPTDPNGPNNLPIGGMLDEPRGRTEAKFPGITATGWRPPDPYVAVGPTAVVQVVNSSLAFFSRAGTKTFESEFLTFFSSLSTGTFLFDPKVFYDWHSGRFVVCCLEEDDGAAVSKVLLAVSDDSDPSGTWYKYRLEAKSTAGGLVCWADYPGFGYNKDGFVVALNLFAFSTGEFKGVEFLAIKKSSVINGGAAVVTKYLNSAADSFSIQVAENLNASSTKVFMVNAATDTKLKVWTFSSLDTTPPAPTSQLVTVAAFAWPDSSGSPSPSGRLLDELDGRIINAMYTGTRLVTTHGVKGVTDDRRRQRWYELSIPATGGVATVAQTGEVKQTTAALIHFYMGAIGKAPTGDIGMIMTKSGDSGPVADIVRTMRASTDPVGTMGTPAVLASAAGSTYGVSGFNRWGDYASISIDPLNQRLMWGTHMTGAAGTDWATHIFSFALSSVTTPCVSALTFSPAAPAGGGSTVTATITTSASKATAQTAYLSSSDTSLATVAPTATIPASSTTGTFSVILQAGVDVSKSVTITVKLNGVAFSKALTVAPAVLSDLTLSLSTIVAGNNVTGTVILNGKAGPAGRTVTLSSDNPVAVIPASITVLSGTKQRSFTVLTANTTTTKTAHITATLGGSVMKTLTVIVPPALTTFTITPTSITGGGTAVAKPTIASAAPAGGVLVKFVETSPFLSIASSALIAAGNTTISISVPTTTVTTSTTETVEARLNGTIKTATLTINP